MRLAPHSQLIDPFAWCAGVMDGCARFEIVHGGRDWAWRLTLATNEVTAHKFASLTGLTITRIGVGRWLVRGETMAPLLAQLIPRMFCLHEEAGVVYRYLITRTKGKRMRRPLTQAVARYREEMRDRLALAPVRQRGER